MDDNLLEKIKEIVDRLDELDNYFEELPSSQSQVDSLICDYRHLIRENDIDSIFSSKLIEKMHKAELTRKKLNKNYDLFRIYSNHKNKLLLKENRQFLLAELYKKEKEWQFPYKYRVLSQNEVESLLKPKKRLRIRGAKIRKEKVVNGSI